MKKQLVIFGTLLVLVMAIVPYNTSAEEQEIEKVELFDEVQAAIETDVQSVELIPTEEFTSAQATRALKMPRTTVTYPEAISTIFPDAGLAQTIATKLGKQVGDTVTKADLETLVTISASGKNISDLTGLEELTKLVDLELSHNAITDISTVNWGAFPDLKTLLVNNNQLTDINAVNWSPLTKLDVLSVAGNQLTDISGVDWSALNALTHLNLESNKIADISGVNWTGLGALKVLKLNINELTNINADWTPLTSLTTLNFVNNKLVDISGVNWDGLTSLQELSFTFNQIANLDQVDWSKLTSLDLLNLSFNKITELETADFSGLSTVRTLHLFNNAIESIDTDWSALTALQVLTLTSNSIKEINTNFNGLGALTQLSLDKNQISKINVDWSKLTSLTNLQLENQTVTLAGVLFKPTLLMDNEVLNLQGNMESPYFVSENGTYDAATGKITWNLTDFLLRLSYSWRNTTQTINGNSFTFSGTVRIPLIEAYQVVFKNYDGSIIKEETIAYGDALVAPAAPIRAGYIFTGWTPSVPAVTPRANSEYTATYQQVTVPPVPTPVPTPNIGRTCQDDGYPKGYDWNGTACVLQSGYKVPNTGVK